MASVQNNQYPRFNLHRRSQPNGSVQKYQPRRYMSNVVPFGQEGNWPRFSPANLPHIPSTLNVSRGRKRRVSESTPGWHPDPKKKRPASEGDVSTARALHFSPFVAPPKPLMKGEERSLKRLSQQILDDYLATRQAPFRYEQKLHLRDYLLSIFRTAFPECSLHICGSTCNGLATNESDIDLCLLISEKRPIVQRYEAIKILHQLNGMLKRSAYLQKCHVIQAKVPILKFRDTKSQCECDININNTVGIKNTHLLQGYCGYDWRVQPLIMIVKKWAKRHGINDASKGTLSSYSIVMMVLHYLQDPCKPAVVPSLQIAYPNIFDESRNIYDLSLENPTVRIIHNSSNNHGTLGELLLGFFQYYAEQFNWNDDVISVRQGNKYPKDTSRVWHKKFICIEEPFDLSCVTRAVHSKDKFEAIKQRIKIAYYTLTVSPFLESIMSGA
ncbi:poly(A) RNA polymerase GLD2-A-like [Dendronephthya gigantea]|uniref:poly(A) RNA polymerase GLD2-A-like n=1 Tax=Dendronephthya gigantea TaxID=151771 RepID=UPI00106A68D4|nr:poly(A) RNA polymerase GLD2-A-like [Dendronephthya gigantea]